MIFFFQHHQTPNFAKDRMPLRWIKKEGFLTLQCIKIGPYLTYRFVYKLVHLNEIHLAEKCFYFRDGAIPT